MSPIDGTALSNMRNELKELLIEALSLEDLTASDISDDEILIGDNLGIDSLDAVEIVVMLKKHYGIELKDREAAREVLTNIDTMARFVCENRKLD